MSNRVAFAIIALALLSISIASSSQDAPAGRVLSPDESTKVRATVRIMADAKLSALSTLAAALLSSGKIFAAAKDDPWFASAESSGDTPYAYTMPDSSHPRQPTAIVLAPRYFAATPRAQAALLIHELGHWQAFRARGSSTEFDGYKLEYDTASRIGLTERDGLTYFAMLDGVVQYVVPRAPAYAKRADVAEYIKS